MAHSVPDVKGELGTVTIITPNVDADTDIDFDDYDAKLDLHEAQPISSIVLLDFDTTGPSFTSIKYTPNDLAAAGSLTGGKFCVIDEDTIRIGDATNVVNHEYILFINGILNYHRNVA